MKNRTLGLLPLLAIFLQACGGAPAGGPTSQPSPETSSSPSPVPAPKPEGESGAALAAHREEFMAACGRDLPNAPDFCQCSWEVFRTMFSEDEMASDAPDPKKMAAFKRKLAPTCGGKIPEPIVRDQFVEACSKKAPDLGGYCQCAWTELRKTLSVADFAIPEAAAGARMSGATKAMAKACAPKLPERVGKKGFVQSCSSGRADAEPFCECAWKELRKSHSATEIFAGAADLDAEKPKIKAACGKLHPSQKQAK